MNIVIFDLETTTTLRETAEILQVGAIILNENFDVVDYINKYVNTPMVNGERVKVPEDSVAIHGITNEFLNRVAPNYEFEDFWKEYGSIFVNGPTVFIAYNADYDTKVLESVCERYNVTKPNFGMRCDTNLKLPRRRNISFCPMQYMSHKTGNKWIKLEKQLELSYGDTKWLNDSYIDFCQRNNIPYNEARAHDALFDCYMTLKILQKECFPKIEKDSSIRKVAF